MDWKEIAVKELMKTRELADYNSHDPVADQRLKAIRERIDAALEAIENLEE